MKKIWQQITGQKHWPRFIRRVNISFRRVKRREVLTFLLFVAIAAFFWIVQTSREDTTTDFTVALIIDDQPQDVVFTTHVPKQLRVSLTDTNARLFNYGYRHSVQSLHVNFERYADAIGNFRVSAAELQSLLSAQLKSSTHIQAVSPSIVDARFAQTEGRKVPVRVTGAVLPAPNYRLHAVLIQPDSVMVHAPNAVLDTLRYVYANGGTHTNLRDSLVEELALELPIGVKATPASVRRTVPVVQYVEKVFEQIPIQVADSVSGTRVIVFPYAARISFLVDMNDYRHITPDMFDVTVSQAECPAGGERHGFLPIHVSYHGPDNEVDNISVTPARAEYVIEK